MFGQRLGNNGHSSVPQNAGSFRDVQVIAEGSLACSDLKWLSLFQMCFWHETNANSLY